MGSQSYIRPPPPRLLQLFYFALWFGHSSFTHLSWTRPAIFRGRQITELTLFWGLQRVVQITRAQKVFWSHQQSEMLSIPCLSPSVLIVPVRDPGRLGTRAWLVGQSPCRDQIDQLVVRMAGEDFSEEAGRHLHWSVVVVCLQAGCWAWPGSGPCVWAESWVLSTASPSSGLQFPGRVSPVTLHQATQGLASGLRLPIPAGRWEQGGASQGVLSKGFYVCGPGGSRVQCDLQLCAGVEPSPLPCSQPGPWNYFCPLSPIPSSSKAQDEQSCL